ncbi:hypothetical protein SAMN05216561_10148 [Nocardioides psychrotolerans]|uniref:YdbS-like PH domain-containing protein n=2 Tax=Nocardioides psychrotolerans TaxID=1005945 RepID=A0A1I3BBV0_9ACTN|nr:hypothetical protein SAMN05216561_10148 [Nocardioides psychrotolerans]
MWQLSNLVEGTITVAVLAAGLAVWDAIDLRWWMVGLGIAGVAVYAGVVPQWRYVVHRWEVSETAVYTQTGWWARERRIAPMSRIQTVDYAETAIARLFGLATVTVTTASAAGALQIAGLDQERARRLVDELTLKADAVEGDAT